MFKQQFKKILNNFLASFNLKIIRLDKEKIIDLTKSDYNLLSVQYFSGLKQNVINIEMDKGRTDRWFDMTNKSIDPAIFAIRTALKKDLKGEELYKNILLTLKEHKSLTGYVDLAKYLDIDIDDNQNLKKYPWWAHVYPWESCTFVDKLKYYPQMVKKNRLNNGMKILSNNSEEIMKDDFENSLPSHARQYAEITEQIRNNGFIYSKDYTSVSAEIFVDKDAFCWKVGLEGNHRIAAAAALGLERIPVNITKVIRLDELKHWPNVKLGYFSEKQAIKIFYNIFNANPSQIHQKWIKKRISKKF